MKFLSVGKVKDSFMMMPPAAMIQIMEVSMSAMEQQKKQGKILDYYYSPAGYQIVILNYETAEEWSKDQISIPILNYVDNEVYPLTEGFSIFKGLIEASKMAEK